MSFLPRENWFNDDVFDRFFAPRASEQSFFNPRVDIIEKEDHFEITAELPGVKKDDINIDLHQGVLTLKAETKQEIDEEKDKVIRKERRIGQFMRSFNVGEAVSEHDITAEFENGVLKLIAPKMVQQPSSARKIPIR